MEKGLEGKTDTLPKEVLDACPWEAMGKTWRANEQTVQRFDKQLEELDGDTLQRLGVMPRVPEEREKAPPPLWISFQMRWDPTCSRWTSPHF